MVFTIGKPASFLYTAKEGYTPKMYHLRVVDRIDLDPQTGAPRLVTGRIPQLGQIRSFLVSRMST